MNVNPAPILIGLLLTVAIGILVFIDNDDFPAPSTEIATTTAEQAAPATDDDEDDSGKGRDHAEDDAPAPVTTPTPTPAGPSGITMAEVAAHNSKASCWSAINGSVYDLTSWVPEHPGGEKAILRICGTDGSARYNGQHGGASKQAAILAGFKIGILAP